MMDRKEKYFFHPIPAELEGKKNRAIG